MIALIITHIQMYEAMKLRDLYTEMFSLHVKKCLVRNRCEYFNMIENNVRLYRRHNVSVGSAS